MNENGVENIFDMFLRKESVFPEPGFPYMKRFDGFSILSTGASIEAI